MTYPHAVWIGPQQDCEHIARCLRAAGLQVELQPAELPGKRRWKPWRVSADSVPDGVYRECAKFWGRRSGRRFPLLIDVLFGVQANGQDFD